MPISLPKHNFKHPMTTMKMIKTGAEIDTGAKMETITNLMTNPKNQQIPVAVKMNGHFKFSAWYKIVHPRY